MNVVVTGAGSGIGQAIALAFLARGDNVVAVDKSFPAEMGPVQDRLHIFERDITVEGALNDPLRVYGLTDPMDGLVNCAGVAGRRPFQYMDREEWDRVVDVNLWGTANCCQAFIRHTLVSGPVRGDQWIVNIASMTGQIGNGEGFTNAHYAASKAGVVGLTKALAIEFAKYHIRVNAVLPGPISTPMLDNFRETNPSLHRQFLNDIPLNHLPGKPSDVAQAVLYLADAPFVTGATLAVDGGFTSQ